MVKEEELNEIETEKEEIIHLKNEVEKDIESLQKIENTTTKDFKDLTKSDIIKLAYKTDLGHEIKQFEKTFIYKLANEESYPEREIKVNVKVDYHTGNRITFGKLQMLREDFLTVFKLFDSLIEKFCGTLQENLDIEASQMGFFDDNIDLIVISEVKADLKVFNRATESVITMPILVQLLANNVYCIKIGKESFSKVDLYMLYLKFDEIVSISNV